MTTEDLISVLETLLEMSVEIFELSDADAVPWSFISFFNLCGKYNYGLLEFLNRELYASCFQPLMEFLQSVEHVDGADMHESKRATLLAKCARVVSFVFYSHLLDFQVKKHAQQSGNQVIFENCDYDAIYRRILQLTFACVLYCQSLATGGPLTAEFSPSTIQKLKLVLSKLRSEDVRDALFDRMRLPDAYVSKPLSHFQRGGITRSRDPVEGEQVRVRNGGLGGPCAPRGLLPAESEGRAGGERVAPLPAEEVALSSVFKVGMSEFRCELIKELDFKLIELEIEEFLKHSGMIKRKNFVLNSIYEQCRVRDWVVASN